MNDPERGDSRVERTMGILWDVVEDTVLALPKYNLHGTSRGKSLGPNLIEMAHADIMKMKITRLIFFSLSAQTDCHLGNLFGPNVTCIKALSSRSC